MGRSCASSDGEVRFVLFRCGLCNSAFKSGVAWVCDTGGSADLCDNLINEAIVELSE